MEISGHQILSTIIYRNRRLANCHGKLSSDFQGVDRHEMSEASGMNYANQGLVELKSDGFAGFLRRSLFQVLGYGPMPCHIAFILDGNRRYARKQNLNQEKGYQLGFLALLCMLKYCYEMGVRYVTAYAFSIDNFKRRPEEVKLLMDLLVQIVDVLIRKSSLTKAWGIRVRFLGSLELLEDHVRVAVQEAMEATSGNMEIDLLVCIAYTSTNELARGMQGSWKEKLRDRLEAENLISVEDLERHMDFAGLPDADILIRTSGETRLSNFLLWQTTHGILYAPRCLWPEISLRHLVWAVLKYQRALPYLVKKKKKQQ